MITRRWLLVFSATLSFMTAVQCTTTRGGDAAGARRAERSSDFAVKPPRSVRATEEPEDG